VTTMAAESPHVVVRLVQGPVPYEDPADDAGISGAECTFLGRTRADKHPDHGDLLLLRYEAHESMAVKQLQKVCSPLQFVTTRRFRKKLA